MGDLALPKRLAVLILAAAALGACGEQRETPTAPQPEASPPATTDALAATFPDGEMVLCPGDPRCGRQAATDPWQPAVPTCRVQSPQHFTLRCRTRGGGGYQPCPGPGCPNGQIDPEAKCKHVDWSALVDCSPGAPPPARDESTGAPPETE